MMKVQVNTTKGFVEGRRQTYNVTGELRAVNMFKGIPYAKPPIGDLRFKKPVPHDAWTTIKQCYKFGDRCVQKQGLLDAIDRIKCAPTSENCLHLNVFAPAFKPSNGSEKCAVMAFIHGGGFVVGCAQKYGDSGICRHLVAKQEVIVCTIEYRSGLLGFFSTGSTSGICDDNVGLWDIRAALLWIQENISAFGGDPRNVTLWGQSAGSVCVDLLALSPQTTDLFDKMILMAGNSECDWAIHDNVVEKCIHWSQKIGVNTYKHRKKEQELVEELRKLPAKKFDVVGLKADRMEFLSNAKIELEIAPRIDGDFFPEPLSELRSEASQKPMMIGQCLYEGMIFNFPGMRYISNLSVRKLHHLISCKIPERTFSNFVKRRLQCLDLVTNGLGTSTLTAPSRYFNTRVNKKLFTELYSDLFLGIPTMKVVTNRLKGIGNGQAATFLYSFDYCSTKAFGPLSFCMPVKGATHGSELDYIFGANVNFPYSMNSQDKMMIEKMTTYWANFAKYGNPNGVVAADEPTTESTWLPVSEENQDRYLSIKSDTQMKAEFQNGRPLRWLNLLDTNNSI